jgi:DtxR family Mn-dependent transcriptional regulator
MGLTPNTKITLLKVAPFDGPIEVSVRGSKLAIGRGIATKVFVDPQIEEKK